MEAIKKGKNNILWYIGVLFTAILFRFGWEIGGKLWFLLAP